MFNVIVSQIGKRLSGNDEEYETNDNDMDNDNDKENETKRMKQSLYNAVCEIFNFLSKMKVRNGRDILYDSRKAIMLKHQDKTKQQN